MMGVVADSVSQVIDLRTENVLAAPPFGTHVSMDFLRGMGQAGNKFVLILDIDKLLSATALTHCAGQPPLTTSSASIASE